MTLHRRSPLRRGLPLATSPLQKAAQPLRKAVKPLTSRTGAQRLYEAQGDLDDFEMFPEKFASQGGDRA